MPSSSVSFFPIPTAGTTEGTANFSIPVDEYGYVQMSVTASAAGTSRTSNVTDGIDSSAGANGCAQGGGQWLDEGDSVSVSTASASGSSAVANTRITGTSTATFLINGTAVKVAECHAASTTTNGNAQLAHVTGAASAHYSISRFDK